jgi:hypothetical protein
MAPPFEFSSSPWLESSPKIFFAMTATINILGATSQSLVFYGVSVVAFAVALYYYLLPKPIPKIPYNEKSARRIMGDVPEFLALAKAGERPRNFWANLCANHNSAIAQYFPGPFLGPIVVISDFRESVDLFLRRSKSLDRGYIGRLMWEGVGDHHFVAMDASNPKFQESRFLGKDLMSPNYLHTVSLLNRASRSYLHFLDRCQLQSAMIMYKAL